MSTTHSTASSSSSTSLPSTARAPSKPKPVNVFSNDGSFLERFQRGRQEEQDKRKAEEAFANKKLFADRFKNRGKRPPPPDSPHPVTSTDLDLANPAKKPRLDDAPQRHLDSEYEYRYQKQVRGHAGRILEEGGTGVRTLFK